MYWKLGLTLTFLGMVIFGVSFWSRQDFFQIKSVQITGNHYVSSDIILEKFDEAVRQNLFLIFNRRNLFFLPRAEIAREIERELPVRSAYIDMSGLSTVNLEVVEHEPKAIWCGDSTRLDCYLLNTDGLFFVKAPEMIFDDLIEVSGDIAGEVLGQSYTDKKVFNNFISLKSLLKKINIGITKISTEDYETFTLTTINGPVLLIDKKDGPVEIANNLKTTLEQESIHKIQLQNIEYLDLRFSNKVYYKIK
ncbi:MAG TPA: FtsQ-type POTRA domain-containing protein [Candidatus Paceibacterota bacterium]|nr:FtsQ-type POTRA domain-containing protein [Candidatus Paceibacterota bacterium]HRZ34388.1 FtsQ-type POTRA domain-containing protein [Candidatus Paceibacterota bacterium]